MSSIVISGDTSGTITIAAPAVSGTTTLTLPATTGNVVTDTATQTLTNKTLTSPTITGASVSSMASSVITSGTSVASTSGTSIDFTSIPSWVKRITVMFNNVSTSGSSLVMIQLGSSSYTTSGYNGNSSSYTSATPTVVTNTVGFMNSSGGSAGDFRNGAYTLTNLTGNIWICTSQFAVGAYVTTGTGQVALSGTLDRLRVTTFNGTDTFDNGSINILYE